MKVPTVTVLIDAYNYGRFIEEAVESVLGQDFPAEEMEILVVDDGSTDDTAERVKKYSERVQYFRKANGGQASAFNFGFGKARGEIVALLDADDYWLPGKLRRVVEEFQKSSGLGMVYHQYALLDDATKSLKKVDFKVVSGSFTAAGDELFWYDPHPTSCTSYRRKFLERLPPVPEELRILADVWIGLLIPFVAPIQAVPECLMAYRIHGKNLYYGEETELASESRRKRIAMAQIVLEGMEPWLREHGFGQRRDVRAFLDRLVLYEEKERFILEPPGRVRYFRHQMFYDRCYGKHLTWRLRMINFVTAVATVAAGYERRDRVREWVEGAARKIGRSLGWTKGNSPSTSS